MFKWKGIERELNYTGVALAAFFVAGLWNDLLYEVAPGSAAPFVINIVCTLAVLILFGRLIWGLKKNARD
jgi:hypothetical protein